MTKVISFLLSFNDIKRLPGCIKLFPIIQVIITPLGQNPFHKHISHRTIDILFQVNAELSVRQKGKLHG